MLYGISTLAWSPLLVRAVHHKTARFNSWPLSGPYAVTWWCGILSIPKVLDSAVGAVKVLLPLRQVADSYDLISYCYRLTVAFRSGARLSFTSVTPF